MSNFMDRVLVLFIPQISKPLKFRITIKTQLIKCKTAVSSQSIWYDIPRGKIIVIIQVDWWYFNVFMDKYCWNTNQGII